MYYIFNEPPLCDKRRENPISYSSALGFMGLDQPQLRKYKGNKHILFCYVGFFSPGSLSSVNSCAYVTHKGMFLYWAEAKTTLLCKANISATDVIKDTCAFLPPIFIYIKITTYCGIWICANCQGLSLRRALLLHRCRFSLDSLTCRLLK